MIHNYDTTMLIRDIVYIGAVVLESNAFRSANQGINYAFMAYLAVDMLLLVITQVEENHSYFFDLFFDLYLFIKANVIFKRMKGRLFPILI